LSAVLTRLDGQATLTFGVLGNNQALQCNQFSMANNPAGFQGNKAAAGIIGRNRFTVTDIYQAGVAGHFNARNSLFGMSFQQGGTSHFYRMQATLSMAQKFSEKLQAGFSSGISTVKQSDQPGANALFVKLGIVAAMGSKTEISGIIINPWQFDGNSAAEPAALHISLEYKAGKQSRFYIHALQNAVDKAALGLAFSHAFDKHFKMMLSGQSGWEPVSAAFQYTAKNLRISMGTSYHNYLGFSPCLGLLWLRD
jgi:hypothetical protein